MSRATELIAGKSEAERLRRVRYYVGDTARNIPGHLYDFCVDVLNYDALSLEFHGPMLAAWDRIDLKRFRQWEGLEDCEDDALDTLDMWPRCHIKTWCERARVIRYYLWNPAATVTWWHAVEEKADESADAIAEQLQKNDKLRALFPPGVLPAKDKKKFCASGVFTLGTPEGTGPEASRKIGDSPSMVALGAGGEGTGGHSLIVVLDDHVGLNDVLDNQMPKKKQWYRATVCNVVLRLKVDGATRRGWKDAIGTHWDPADPYVDWRSSRDWICTVRGSYEVDGKPCDPGDPTYLSRDAIEKERREQGSMFPFQMQNDPSPPSEKPWSAACERRVSREEWRRLKRGTVFVLSDPAPAKIGSFDGIGAKARRDGSKDEWANAVVEITAVGQLQLLILLDGSSSRTWSKDQGFEEAFRLAKKWGTGFVAFEATGQAVALYGEDIRRAARAIGSKYRQVPLESTYKGKNYRFGSLCSRAELGEFLIADTVPTEFLEKFLEQARGWRRVEGSPQGNGLRFDDCADVVAYAMDPALQQWAPQAETMRGDRLGDGGDFDPYNLAAYMRPQRAQLTRHIPLH